MGNLKKVMTINNSCKTFNGSTIIYCITRKETDEIADLLKSIY